MYYAHSQNINGECETVTKHLTDVSRLCKIFSECWGNGVEGEITGLFHDAGKFSDNFQRVLKGEMFKVDHATPGAAAVLYNYKNNCIASAIAIQGHHDGLKSGFINYLKTDLMMRDECNKYGETYSTRDFKKLVDILKNEYNIPTNGSIASMYPELYSKGLHIAEMLYVRLLFSALVDADYLATEAHFQGKNIDDYINYYKSKFDFREALEKLFTYKKDLENSSDAKDDIIRVRNELFDVCYNAAETSRRIFTLTAPTGSGKTLAMFGFALRHAEHNNLRRIILVLPYLNIIEQTAKIYKEILNDNTVILEDHSLANLKNEEHSRLFAENWDKPIIITTTVKFFESLFSDKPTECRKLHNIANSVILFDEVQTMPANLLLPTLSALTTLYNRFGCSIVFSTATQPAYENMNIFLAGNAETSWKPTEIVPKCLNLFERSRRVKVLWHKEPLSFDHISRIIINTKQSLTIVNTRSQCFNLFNKVRNECRDIFHISTYMCPAHRLSILDEIKRRLKNRIDCRVVSTQCVEAGVDLDFPEVWRAMGPLEAIIQAAGRCNRNGKSEGIVHVFTPELNDEKYPETDYKRGAVTVKAMLNREEIDIYDVRAIKEYYSKYFDFIRVEDKNPKLNDAILLRDFEEVSKHYHWIPSRGINILVPYKGEIELFEELKSEAFERGFSRKWARKAQQLCVNVFVRNLDPIFDYITEIKVFKRGREVEGSGYYILLNEKLYTDEYGIDMTASGGDEFFAVS